VRHKLDAPREAEERSEEPVASTPDLREEKKEPEKDSRRAAAALASALKGFASTLSLHTERQSNLIDVFGAALRELSSELQKSKTKSFSLEVRLREAENRIAQMEKIMGAWTRQGQGWLQ
jgi:hypothetical protein